MVVEVATKYGEASIGSTLLTAVGYAKIVPEVEVAESGMLYAAKARCGTNKSGSKYLSSRINVTGGCYG